MHVVLATTAPTEGGVLRHTTDLAMGLLARGHGVQVATREDAEGAHRRLSQLGLHCTSLAAAARTKCDIWHLHVHNTLDTRVLPLLLVAKTAAQACVVTEHLPRSERVDPTVPRDPSVAPGRPKPGAGWVKDRIKELQFGLADSVIAVSHASATFLAGRYRVSSRKLEVVHNGVDVGATAPPACAAGRPVVMYIGTLDWRKGLDVLLEACTLATTDWDLVVLGSGPRETQLRHQAREIQRSVIFKGWHPQAQRAASEADIFCLPSRIESFPYVVLDAMACGRPVVTTPVDGLSEMVVDGESGLFVSPGDPAALALALDRLASDDGLRARMGTQAYTRARAMFTTELMVGRTIEVYAKALRHS